MVESNGFFIPSNEHCFPLKTKLVKSRIKEFVTSGKYWTIVIDPNTRLLWLERLSTLERACYSGEKNEDYNAMLVPGDGKYWERGGVVFMVFALKKHASSKELQKYLGKSIPSDPVIDMLVLTFPNAQEEYALPMMRSIVGWFASFCGKDVFNGLKGNVV